MPRQPARFRQSDLARLIRSARDAGAVAVHIELVNDGTIKMDVELTDKDDRHAETENLMDRL
jgi:hypothetical protein